MWQQTGVQYDEHSETRVNHVSGRRECMYDGENLWQLWTLWTGVQYDEHSENRVNHVLGRRECMYDGENRENYEHCDNRKGYSMMNTLKTV